MTRPDMPSLLRALLAGTALAALAACDETMDLDLDLRGGSFDTSDAVRNGTAQRPAPDQRGIISYPNYQVAVARRGDTVADVAARAGLGATELARYNGVTPQTRLRAGEVMALPGRVAATGPQDGPIIRSGQVDVASVAGEAIDSAGPNTVRTTTLAPAAGPEPVRHRVERGETAYTIARLYGVSVRALAEWNGLGPDFAVREGQFLLIPVAREAAQGTSRTDAATPPPGSGSPTPTPPSATRPLPEEDAAPAARPQTAAQREPVQDLGRETQSTDTARMVFPVDGPIIREYARGRNNGIAIGAAPGTPVRAAAAGEVAAVTSNTDEVSIVVVKHPDNLLTVYVNLDDISVTKGARVSRGQTIARVAGGDPSFLHFEVTRGTERVDPMPYLTP
ncbi:peptidoglycan DD-metalloendopeptidase family protein [Rhodosalinus sp. 5P4]|uniref:peptidoglycan DD-metalloendopeptidase family protein n=1 Tax=Rhodosalinus sp. 5P4 TaxID=3239196 RepID=UPI00352434CD